MNQCLCEQCVRDQASLTSKKIAIPLAEYKRLVIEQIKEIKQTALEEKQPFNLREAVREARQIVSDFYEIVVLPEGDYEEMRLFQGSR